MSEEETEKVNLTVKKGTVKRLREEYPEALSDQEAARMAISDALSNSEK